jgi:hypothetical protein
MSALYPRTEHAKLFHARHRPWMDLFLARTLSAARSVASTVPPSALLALESSSKSQGWSLCPLTPWAQTASFLYWRSLAGKNRQRFCPVRFSPEICQTTPATQAILDDHASPHGRHGQLQPPFCAGVLGLEKFWQRFRAVRFSPGKKFRGQTKQRQQPLAITRSVGRVVGSPVGGYICAYLVQYLLVGRTTQLTTHQLCGLMVQCLDRLAARLLDG